MQSKSIALFPLLLMLLAGQLVAQEVYREPETPSVAAASEEGQQSLASFQIPAAWRANLFAAEPDVANPVAFKIDHRGRVWVCESFRQGIGVTDNRKHDRNWVNDDLASQTVGDRLAFHLKHLKDNAIEYARYDDRIRLLVDRDGDGRVDDAKVFSDHYNHIEEGTGAGVLPVGDHVYYSCIPNLWQLTDQDGDGRADERKSLHSGYGVRVAFRGHDMHGMIVGPDGKLYYSIGDRGYNVTTPDGHFVDPASGAVFRCNLDGSDLEVVATGLRNPQELAFDDFGNLFTGDNNSDSGDQARWVYVAEGGDSGWRMYYQYLPDRGPFNREKLWHPRHAGQAAYIVPPICNFADGPAGLMYYPGTGLSAHFDQRFFLCDFRGTPSQSGIRTFKVEADGAFFKMVDDEKTLWNVLATDVDFGADGALYVTDWVNGWNGEGKGRIYRFVDPEANASEAVKEVRRLLGGEIQQASNEELLLYLGHVDRRVRMQAQFALVDRQAVESLAAAARSADSLLPRLHGLWGTGQLVERQQTNSKLLLELLSDSVAEIRAQAAKLVGDHGIQAAADRLLEQVRDEHPRVCYFAALSLGKLRDSRAVAPVLEMLVENDGRDPIVRHGAIMALAGMDDEDLQAAFRHPAAEVRLALVVALRKKHSSRVSELLRDSEPLVVLEAARAIHDAVVAPGAGESQQLAELADSISRPTQEVALVRRVLNANYRLGKPHHARVLADYAANSQAPAAMRLEALQMLGQWAQPAPRDRVLGRWHPLPDRNAKVAAAAMRDKLASIVARAPDQIRVAAVATAAKLGLTDAVMHLRALVVDQQQDGKVRSDSLRSLAQMDAKVAGELAAKMLQDREPVVRAESTRILAKQKPELAIESLERAIQSESMLERQAALATLATLSQPAARRIVASAVGELLAGQAPPETHLDILEAAERSKEPDVQRQLKEFRSRSEGGSATKRYAEAMFGGDASQGRKIFFEKVSVSCIRCHRIENSGGRVGPNLDERVAEWSKLPNQEKRRYVLESLVEPSKQIVKGFQSILIVNDEGEVITGVKTAETKNVIQIVTGEAKIRHIAKDSIEQMRVSDQSAMPDDVVKSLSKRELRDLVEYLATHQAPATVVETEE